ncbi:uncharacterized protein MKK02DRAFT_41780 [Dioszegia hungarica]|uniref:Uncharacterized protein n=1 Tax=Dioszegia hungarica TaxID=4972 RepID=A0AA38HGX2_9TREE|nr:uncharacterized protein MKK02DRAFT_41780 [Dioszegia hungarica]KAI9638754.1 hypothetical protein MKK02DRAFT_41780 [Dioszegia hungarica]
MSSLSDARSRVWRMPPVNIPGHVCLTSPTGRRLGSHPDFPGSTVQLDHLFVFKKPGNTVDELDIDTTFIAGTDNKGLDEMTDGELSKRGWPNTGGLDDKTVSTRATAFQQMADVLRDGSPDQYISAEQAIMSALTELGLTDVLSLKPEDPYSAVPAPSGVAMFFQGDGGFEVKDEERRLIGVNARSCISYSPESKQWESGVCIHDSRLDRLDTQEQDWP